MISYPKPLACLAAKAALTPSLTLGVLGEVFRRQNVENYKKKHVNFKRPSNAINFLLIREGFGEGREPLAESQGGVRALPPTDRD